jgi:hypothetical protein
MKLGISSEDLQDLIATRLNLMKKVCTASSEGTGNENWELGLKLPPPPDQFT